MKKMIFQKSLFPELDQDALKLSKQKSKEKYLIRKNRMFGLEYCKDAIFSGKYGILFYMIIGLVIKSFHLSEEGVSI